jgi:hypothetical protein
MSQILDISIGHAPDAGWLGAKSADGLYEYAYHHDSIRPALEAAAKTAGVQIRWWDAAEHQEWRRTRRGNLLLLDRLKAIFGATPAPQILIDLHCNASKNTRYGGQMAIYRKDRDGSEDARSLLLASLLCGRLAQGVPGLKNRGAQGDLGDWVGRDLALCRWSKKKGVVGVILELGFLTCPSDVAVLRAAETPRKVAEAIMQVVSQWNRSS